MGPSSTTPAPSRLRRPREYPFPTEVRPWAKTAVRPVLPLEQPPLPTKLPALPSAPRQPSFSSTYTLSTHLVPAAYPRSYPHVPAPAPAPPGETPMARKARITHTAQEIVRNRALYEQGALGSGSTAPLWCAVNRYVRCAPPSHTERPRGVTLFLAHATSLPKEIWEPTIEQVLALQAGDPGTPEIDEIWSFEAVQHGDSSLVNKDNLCGLWDIADGARDMLHFLRFYLPEAASSAVFPTHLPRLTDGIADARLTGGFAGRTVVGIGHSLGGTCLVFAAIAQPALFRDSCIVSIDPFICAPYCNTGPTAARFIKGSLARYSSWPSSAAAHAAFRSNPFFANWEPAMLKIYADCALYRPDPESEAVELKTDGTQEAMLFECRTPFELWELVETLDPRIAIRWVMPRGQSVFGGDNAMVQELVWRRPQNSSNVIIDAGHMIPQEAPREFAQDLTNYLRERFGEHKARL